MNFKLTIEGKQQQIIPINYQYPLSAALYKILEKGNEQYAEFLHDQGYGKGFKFFTFSQISCPFKIDNDRLKLLSNSLTLMVSFHIPQAMESFIKGLFQSEQIEIADKKSKARFSVKSVESLPNILQQHKENEIVNVLLTPLSPVVSGLQNEKGNYDFLAPDDPRFTENLIFNWRSKISACYSEDVAASALLLIEVVPMRNPPKSRLITIKADTEQETKIRGWMNFELKVSAERRFLELLMNAGVGLYNAQGMGCVSIRPIAFVAEKLLSTD